MLKLLAQICAPELVAPRYTQRQKVGAKNEQRNCKTRASRKLESTALFVPVFLDKLLKFKALNKLFWIEFHLMTQAEHFWVEQFLVVIKESELSQNSDILQYLRLLGYV